MNDIIIARQAILDELKRRAKAGDKSVKPNPPGYSTPYGEEDRTESNYYSGAGEMDCPICKKGKLRYSRSGYNGHVHAACTTEGCVSWVE